MIRYLLYVLLVCAGVCLTGCMCGPSASRPVCSGGPGMVCPTPRRFSQPLYPRLDPDGCLRWETPQSHYQDHNGPVE